MSDASGNDGSNGGEEERPERNGDGSDGGSDGDSQSEQRQETSTLQTVVILVSVGLTVLLFAYAGWQMVVAPGTAVPPQVAIEETRSMANDSVAVDVRLRNPNSVGLVTATVQSDCSSPPPTVQFSYVPASSTRTGTLVCPPGTTNASVSMANWVSP